MRIGDVSTGIPTVDTRLFEEAWRNAAASLARFWEDADPMISSPEFQATLALSESAIPVPATRAPRSSMAFSVKASAAAPPW